MAGEGLSSSLVCSTPLTRRTARLTLDDVGYEAFGTADGTLMPPPSCRAAGSAVLRRRIPRLAIVSFDDRSLFSNCVRKE